jgi:hypothetical protein
MTAEPLEAVDKMPDTEFFSPAKFCYQGDNCTVEVKETKRMEGGQEGFHLKSFDMISIHE